MCGINAYFSRLSIDSNLQKRLIEYAMKSQMRGPDNTNSLMVDENTLLTFHRLAINDTSEHGNQPLLLPHNNPELYLVCNAEIYNFHELNNRYSFDTYSQSDCEVILHMYKRFGIEETLKSLDGPFGFVLVDKSINKAYVARDPIGIRSVYIGFNVSQTGRNYSDNTLVLKECPVIEAIGISSEMKSLVDSCNFISQFKPGCYLEIDLDDISNNMPIFENYSNEFPELNYKRYYHYDYKFHGDNEVEILKKIKDKLVKATEKRLMSDRPVGCLLSGGLDSSLITSIVANIFAESKRKGIDKGTLHTFSIGLQGSVDLKYAEKVSEHLKNYVYSNIEHHEVVVTEHDMLGSIEDTIRQIESYDTTTVRASTPMFLLSKHIATTYKDTGVVVVLSGEGSDEISGSYMYFHNAPNKDEFYDETLRLLKDLCYFDVLRGDKSTAGAGLEIRVPFLDKEFLDYYMGVDPRLKMPKTYGIEKYLLRKAFDGSNLLPKDVLWRVKEAFSDGVSSQQKSWYQIIQEFINTKVSDSDFDDRFKYSYNTPALKESYYYRNIFSKYYKGHDKTIPYYWLPRWVGNVVDPSARTLSIYSEQMTNQ